MKYHEWTLFAFLLLAASVFAQNPKQPSDSIPERDSVVLSNEDEEDVYIIIKGDDVERKLEEVGRNLERSLENIKIKIRKGRLEVDWDDDSESEVIDSNINLEDMEAALTKRLDRVEAELSRIRSEQHTYKKADWQRVEDEMDELDAHLDNIDDHIWRYDEQLNSGTIRRSKDLQRRYDALYDNIKSDLKKAKLKNVKTRWFLADLGFSTYVDESRAPRIEGVDPTEPRLGKSVGFTLHIMQQRLNLVDHHLNLIYGFGLQSNNYGFDNPVELVPNTGDVTFEVFPDRNYSKNRLKANYIHIPVMLNYEGNPGYKKKSLRLQAGPYLNILYSSNFKTKINGDKTKTKDNFSLNRFQTGLYGQVGYGPLNFYMTYGLNGLFDADENSGYDLTPISFGIKLLPF